MSTKVMQEQIADYFKTLQSVRPFVSTKYWRKLKQRLKAEGNESVTNCHALLTHEIDGILEIYNKRTVPLL